MVGDERTQMSGGWRAVEAIDRGWWAVALGLAVAAAAAFGVPIPW